MRDWLKGDYVVTAAPPASTGLVAWYKFDDADYSTLAVDSSGNGNNAPFYYGIGGWFDTTGGHDGSGCLIFDGTIGLLPPASLFSSINNQVTFSVWVKGDAYQYQNAQAVIFQAKASDNNRSAMAFIPSSGYVAFDSGYTAGGNYATGFDSVSYGCKTSSEFEGTWQHYAFVKDANAGVVRIYHNGTLMVENANSFLGLNGSGMTDFSIGSYTGGNLAVYKGEMDDFRIYSRALSQAEIVSLAGLGSVNQKTLSPAEVTGDGKINFADFAKMFVVWMQPEVKWPF